MDTLEWGPAKPRRWYRGGQGSWPPRYGRRLCYVLAALAVVAQLGAEVLPWFHLSRSGSLFDNTSDSLNLNLNPISTDNDVTLALGTLALFAVAGLASFGRAHRRDAAAVGIGLTGLGLVLVAAQTWSMTGGRAGMSYSGLIPLTPGTFTGSPRAGLFAEFAALILLGLLFALVLGGSGAAGAAPAGVPAPGAAPPAAPTVPVGAAPIDLTVTSVPASGNSAPSRLYD